MKYFMGPFCNFPAIVSEWNQEFLLQRRDSKRLYKGTITWALVYSNVLWQLLGDHCYKLWDRNICTFSCKISSDIAGWWRLNSCATSSSILCFRIYENNTLINIFYHEYYVILQSWQTYILSQIAKFIEIEDLMLFFKCRPAARLPHKAFSPLDYFKIFYVIFDDE